MSKYDFELDLSGNTSTGMIMSKIKKGSTVLEFGCATGRMTRYMREALDCRVYIVEFEETAFQKAMAYAQDGLCDDIMNYRWVERFRDVKFDAVVFADVLEHLSRPEDVLRAVADLLKEDGTVHISVPNITHNDILINAFQERFDYTKVGLLDDTHIHFWGLENLKQLASGSGLYLQSVEATYCRTGETEQRPQLGERTAWLENMLRHRACGEVDQCGVTLAKQACEAPVFRNKAPTARMHLYLDTGSDFNGKEVLSFEAEPDDCGGYVAHYRLPQGHGVRRIRLDPVEHQGCILTRLRICQNGQDLPVGYSESVRLDVGVCLLGDDPAVYADVSSDEVELEARMVLPGAEYEKILRQQYSRKLQEWDVLSQELQHQKALAEATDRRNKAVIANWEAQVAAAKKEIGMLGRELEQVRADLCGYIILSNHKEKYILELEQIKWNLEQKNLALEQRILALEQHNQVLDQMVRYRNTLRGLLRGLAGWTVRKLRFYAGKVLRRNKNG